MKASIERRLMEMESRQPGKPRRPVLEYLYRGGDEADKAKQWADALAKYESENGAFDESVFVISMAIWEGGKRNE